MHDVGNFSGVQRDHSQRVNKKQNVESTVVPQAEATKSTWSMLTFLGLHLRQHCQFLALAYLLKTVFEKELMKTIGITINTT